MLNLNLEILSIFLAETRNFGLSEAYKKRTRRRKCASGKFAGAAGIGDAAL